MAVKFANNVSTSLSAAINATQTTISVADASGLPTLSSGDYIYLTIDTDTNSPTIEVVKVTGVSTNTLTVVRGQDGTTASSFSSGAKVELRVTAAALDDISSAADTESVSIAGDTMTGQLNINYGAPVLRLKDTTDDDDHHIQFANATDVVVYSIDTQNPISGDALTFYSSGQEIVQRIGSSNIFEAHSNVVKSLKPLEVTGTGTTNTTYSAVFKNNNGDAALRVRDDGRVLIEAGYLYVNHNEGIYSTGLIRARGGISNDGGNALSISSGAAHITFNSKNFASVGTISSGAITSSSTGRFQGGLGSQGLYIDSTANFANQAFYAPGLLWRQTDGTNIAGIRGYINAAGVNHLVLGTGWLDQEVFISPTGVSITGTLTASSYSGTLVSSVTATTQTASDNSTKVATTAYVTTAVDNIVSAAPGSLDTLNELAAALGDDANFSTTVTNSIATKLPLAGGTMTGELKTRALTIINPVTTGRVEIGTIANDQQNGYVRGSVIFSRDENQITYDRTTDQWVHAGGSSTDWSMIAHHSSGASFYTGPALASSTSYTNAQFASAYRWLEVPTGTKIPDFKVRPTVSGNNIWHSGDFSNNSSNWNTAYGWGNHASAGYLTAVPSKASPLTSTELGAVDLDDYAQADDAGFYHQTANADATNGDNWPNNRAGSLLVQKGANTGGYGTTQLFIDYDTSDVYVRSMYNTGAANRSWVKLYDTSDFTNNSTNWDSAYTYSLVGHLPLTGGTLTGVVQNTNNLNVDGPNFNVSTTNKSVAEYAYRVDRSGSVVGGVRIDGRLIGPDAVIGGATVSAAAIGNWNTAYGWGDHASGGYSDEYKNYAVASGADHDTHHWNKTHAAYSNAGSSPTYIVLTTNVPQDSYSMGGFTLVFQNEYNNSGNDEGDTITIYGYWNPEVNGGFIGFRYHTSNPDCAPTIQVGRNTSGKTVFLISNESGNYAQVVAKDLWFGYSASSAASSWGDSWAFSEASATTGISNLNTLNRVGITAAQRTNWNTAYTYSQVGHLAVSRWQHDRPAKT